MPDVVGAGYGSFWRSRARYRVVKGGRGSKKSATAALWFVFHVMKHAGANVLVVRRTAKTHKDSTFAQLRWAADRLGVLHLWRFTVSPLECVFLPTGQRILFRGFDDPLKLTSITVPTGVLCWVWLEEAFEIEDEADFDTLDESIRGEMPDGLWKQLTLTFNPWVSSHWTKRRFFDRVDPDAFTLTTTFRCNEWLDEADRRKIEDLEFSNPERFRVVGLGDYGLPGGTYFGEFRSDVHVVEPFEIPDWWRRFRAMDYGFDMLAVPFFAVDPHGWLFLYREVYEPGLNLSQAARRVLAASLPGERFDYTVSSPDLWNRSRESGVPEVETMVAAGLSDLVRADNRRVPGWRQLREYLHVVDSVGADGFPVRSARLRIFSSCRNAIRTLSSVVQDVRNPEDVCGEPHELTHLPEAIRYGVMSRPEVPRVWESPIPAVSRRQRDIEEVGNRLSPRETEEYL